MFAPTWTGSNAPGTTRPSVSGFPSLPTRSAGDHDGPRRSLRFRVTTGSRDGGGVARFVAAAGGALVATSLAAAVGAEPDESPSRPEMSNQAAKARNASSPTTRMIAVLRLMGCPPRDKQRD